MRFAQLVAIIICIGLAVFGSIYASIGAVREASGDSPGDGLVMIIIGTICLGFAGIIVSIAAKILND